MAEFKEAIRYLCTEEMIDNKTAPQVRVKNKIGYLVSYDYGLGFGFISEEGEEYELNAEEIDLWV